MLHNKYKDESIILILQNIVNQIQPNSPPSEESYTKYRPGSVKHEERCGLPNKNPVYPSLRVTGGKETPENFYPWMVALVFKYSHNK